MFLPNESSHYHMFYRIEGAGTYLEPLGSTQQPQGCCLHPCIFPWIGARVLELDMGEHYVMHTHLIHFIPMGDGFSCGCNS